MVAKFKKHWKIILIISGVFLAALITWTAYLRWGTGWGWADGTGFVGKTLWDWLELLIIPIVLALGAFWLERSERASDRRIAKERFELEQKLADQRIENEQKLAEQRREDDKKIAEDRRKDDQEKARDQQREIALLTYIDKMTELLLDKDRPLRETKLGDEARAVARARTLATLRTLDPVRKGMLLMFLNESELITTDFTIISLLGADLSGAFLYFSDLQGTNLIGTNLMRANLSNAMLQGTDLSDADLEWADLSGANLAGANLENANFLHTNLGGANLVATDITVDQLLVAKTLRSITMPDGNHYDPDIHILGDHLCVGPELLDD